MSKISDELREWCESENETGCGGFVTGYSFEELCDLADRIDSEMVELPRDMDGLPIHAGDTVYLEDGRKADVLYVHIGRHSTSIDFKTCGDGRIFFEKEPEHFVHTPLDSLERIADDLDEMVDGPCPADDVCEKLADLAERIRKLAKKEDKR